MVVDPVIFKWVVLPLLIFLARIVDVSIGTIRIISLQRGLRKLTPILGFIEILIWLMAIRQIFSHLDNPLYYVAYAGGFASGIAVGMWIEHRLAMGVRLIRVITRYDATALIASLRERGYGVTVADAEGNDGPVKIIFMLVKRRAINEITKSINAFNPNAFYSIEDVRAASAGIYPGNGTTKSRFWSNVMRYEKKGK